MIKNILLIVCTLFLGVACIAQSDTILVKTNYGNFKAVLYDYTPQHRDLLLDAIRRGVYTEAQFNRVIAGFVTQGGELDEDILAGEALEPAKVAPRLAPEFDDRAFHKVGALGAGRDDNPSKSSYLNQLYFVVGKPVTEADLRVLEQAKGVKYTDQQRAVYLSQGGQPRLDKDYTVFGEVIEGLDVLIKMSKVATNANDKPLEKVLFTMEIVN